MNEFITKLIERLEQNIFVAELYGFGWDGQRVSNLLCLGDVKEQAEQLAEEYNNESVKGDLISRSALLEEIKSLRVTVMGLRSGKGILAEYAKQYKDTLLRVIEEQPTTYNNGWIPCSKRLPSNTAYYLVTIKGFNRPMYAWWLATERKWQYLNSTKVIQDVIAWCELPAPYQPKGE